MDGRKEGRASGDSMYDRFDSMLGRANKEHTDVLHMIVYKLRAITLGFLNKAWIPSIVYRVMSLGRQIIRLHIVKESPFKMYVATDYCNAVRACIRCIFVARIYPPRQTQYTSEQKRLIRSSAQILLTKIHSVVSHLRDIQPNGTFESLPSRTPHGHMACAQYCM